MTKTTNRYLAQGYTRTTAGTMPKTKEIEAPTAGDAIEKAKEQFDNLSTVHSEWSVTYSGSVRGTVVYNAAQEDE